MKIKEIMTHTVEVIHPSDTLQNAAEKMRDHDIGFLPVYNGGELIGVLTDRDIVVRAMAKGANPRTMLSWELITSPAIYCFDDQDVEEATRLMRDNQIRRLVILSRRDKGLVGVVALSDLALNADGKLTEKVLQKVFEPV